MTIHYPFAHLPAAGETFEVAPGVRWLRMPLPFALDHINLWLVADGADDQGQPGWAAVDTGISLDTVKESWRTVLAQHRLTRQIVTHCHPDHLGLAAWLEQETGARLWITQGEYFMAHMTRAEIDAYSIVSMLDLFRRHGLGAEPIAALIKRGNAFLRGVPDMPRTFKRLLAGDELTLGGKRWRVIVGYGHSPEHAALYCDELRVLISGDMLLPRISTNVSVFAPNPDADPLSLFLDSIARFLPLPEDTLVLPSHGKPFRGLHARVAQLQQHHRERCAVLLPACATPKSAAELIPVMFERDIPDAHQNMFAMGEMIAHLNYLEKQEKLRRIDENGMIRFVCRS